MSTAWMMFYSRRYRSPRSEPDPKPDLSSSSRGSDRRRTRHDNGVRRPRHDNGGRCPNEDQDPHRRSPSRRTLRANPEPVQRERTNSKFRAAIVNSDAAASRENIRASREDIRTRIIRTHPLPAHVEEARQRLVQRLGNLSLAGSREVVVDPSIIWDRIALYHPLPAPVEEARQRLVQRLGNLSLAGSREVVVDPSIIWDRIALYHRFAMPDTREREPVVLDRIEPGLSNEEFLAQLSTTLTSRDVSREKTPCINLEAQHHEVFRNSEEGTGSTRGLLECCICLEKLLEGDELIVLNCAHRFHKTCLEPWVLTSNNCPYCRASIV